MRPNAGLTKNVLGLLLGFTLGLALTSVPLYAQTQDGTAGKPYLVTQTGGWNKVVKCQATGLALTVAVDGAAAVPAVGVTWGDSGDPSAPFAATIPMAQMPAAIRTVGMHTLAITSPATTLTLADGSPYTYPAATYTEYLTTLSDTPTSTPPKDGGWKKIIGSLAVAFGGLFIAWLAHSGHI